MSLLPWTAKPGTLRIAVRLTPKSGRDEIGGVEETVDGPALKARVRAAPEDGKANAALIALMADWLGVPKSSIELAAGSKSRRKVLTIADPQAMLAKRIAEHLSRSKEE